MNPVLDTGLAQQIADTVRDVCGHPVNFIDCEGLIIASTDPARIGTYHRIGRQAAASGQVLEVKAGEDDRESGIRSGVNLPVSYNQETIAVIGISGPPEEVRRYADLALHITQLLIRERQLLTDARTENEKKLFLIQTLISDKGTGEELPQELLREAGAEISGENRFLIIRAPFSGPEEKSLLEQTVRQTFASAGIRLYARTYPRDYLAVVPSGIFAKKAPLFEELARANGGRLQIAAGASRKLRQTAASYESCLTVLKSLPEGQYYAVYEQLTLEIMLAGLPLQSREEYRNRMLSGLSPEDIRLLELYYRTDMSLAETCRLSFLHKNTVQYKLNAIARRTGCNPRHFREAVKLYLALCLR